MSAVWLHVGQCGNQIGEEWWQILTRENVPHAEADRYPFCSPDGKLSAICVDSEPKVVRKLQKQVKSGSFRKNNLIVGKRGRGNNWAYGYHGLHSANEKNLLERTMESLRKEVERRDCYCGTMLFHSLSGGTGAGLGSRLCEAIRDENSLGQILTVTVAPHQAGESPLQHYNSLLCLSWLQRHVDGVLLFQNDAVLRRTAALLGKKAPVSDMQPQVSLSAMNTYVASCLAGLFYPLKAFTTGSGISVGMEPWELLRSACPMPTMRFLHLAQACKRQEWGLSHHVKSDSEPLRWGTVFWDSLASSVVHSLPRESHAGQPHYSTSVLAVARSYQEDTFLLSRDSVLRKLKQAYHEAYPWNPFSLSCWTDSLNIVEPGCHSHLLTICANHGSSAELLQQVVARAEAMYETNAYLHWYWRYGCEEADFQQAFETLCSVADDYSRLGE
ncbi:LOW QUALITY PROTEIN: tubulin delta chain-like [Trachemys scripta elegans]|uniref:LOW QUALITY PROTEIN: tubulin delta chain-like n=1 Tax=Trachemys scripta elegans TaxID=31138 RepID=UPI001552580E|nr:LOW QUALITY PROTEIN: tubulin delta chain-like [Trachemys scripta elegans]